MPTVPDHVPADRVLDIELYGAKVPGGDVAAMLRDRFAGAKPVVFIPPNGRNPYGSWVFTSHQLIRDAFLDTTHFTSHHASGFNLLAGLDELLIPVEYDPPDHGRYRAFINPDFTRPAVEALSDTMRGSVVAGIERLAGRGGGDVLPACLEMIVAVWCKLMGAPPERGERYLGFMTRMLHTYDPQVRGTCALEMLEEMRLLYRMHKDQPHEGLINRFVNGDIRGAAVSETEAACFILFMFMAGLDTMGSTAGWVLYHLAQHPAEVERLQEAPEAIASFVEEIIRRYAIVTTNRFVKKELAVDGVVLHEGDNVLLSLPLSCMDPTAFSCPMKVDPERSERHIAFGAGAHFCVGALLARTQLRILIEEWLKRIPRFELDPDAQVSAHMGDVAQLDRLDLVWAAA